MSESSPHAFSVVIPAFNEAERVPLMVLGESMSGFFATKQIKERVRPLEPVSLIRGIGRFSYLTPTLALRPLGFGFFCQNKVTQRLSSGVVPSTGPCF